jgi:hypothetical protein
MSSMAVQTQHKKIEAGSEASPWIPISQVNEPGTYVSRATGDLIRITKGGVAPDDEEAGGKAIERNIEVAIISRNPFIRITEARILAANLDVPVNF